MLSLPKRLLPLIVGALTIAGCTTSNEHSSNEDKTIVVTSNSNNELADNTNYTIADANVATPNTNTADDAALFINSSNYQQITQSAINALSLIELNKEKDIAEALLNELNSAGWKVIDGADPLSGLTLATTEEVPVMKVSADLAQLYDCNSGGSLVLLLNNFNGAPIIHRRVTFTNCRLNGTTYNGGLEYYGQNRLDKETLFENFSATTSDKTINLTGQHVLSYTASVSDELRSWVDTSFTYSTGDTMTILDNLNWQRDGVDDASGIGYVQLLDGTLGRIARSDYSANLEANFNYFADATQVAPFEVAANLSYKSTYYEWTGDLTVGYELPTYPISTLGPTIEVYRSTDISGDSITISNVAEQDPTPQWQSGGMRVTAIDSSTLALRPNENEKNSILIEINDSGEQISHLWADGYQIACPELIKNCGGKLE